MTRRTKVWLTIFILLNVADCVLTYLGLMHGGEEANPLAKLLIRKFGLIQGMLLLKLGATPFVIVLAKRNLADMFLGASLILFGVAILPWLVFLYNVL